ncbi:MAG: hypothetical protein COS63_01395 [Anaerolineae bacterium CG06_land_8_20_14_3_00_57_67]|nr:MAG: hypothetical protein COS63_01395 [Anaerolineae bacterium CG06_land_8_20_14_3_00_57_67]PIX46891.1 MAG: hypothetical protein COZ54_02665 [Anaerolineae bacterium CG_4_8_14_3_um_filter_59_70]
MLARARYEGQWHAGQADAAALCFDVLALFPDCAQAGDLVYELFCDEWTIYDNRVAIQRNIDEWDDRPWQQRRRLALSFRFMSRWQGWEREYLEGYEHEKDGPPDVAKILEAGKIELLGAYCLGDEECTDYTWMIFAEALERTNDPRAALLWIGKTYADLGFLADSAEALAELCSRFTDPDARRLLAEVIWWRDNAYRIPWIPPRGDGTRYNRMMQHIDPSAPSDEEVIRYFREKRADKSILPYTPSIDPGLARLLESAIPNEPQNAPASPLDWSFLDLDDGQPGEPADWVKKQIKLFERDGDDEVSREMIEEMKRMHRWTRNIRPPATPPRYDPNEPPFDPRDILGSMDDDLADDI